MANAGTHTVAANPGWRRRFPTNEGLPPDNNCLSDVAACKLGLPYIEPLNGNKWWTFHGQLSC